MAIPNNPPARPPITAEEYVLDAGATGAAGTDFAGLPYVPSRVAQGLERIRGTVLSLTRDAHPGTRDFGLVCDQVLDVFQTEQDPEIDAVLRNSAFYGGLETAATESSAWHEEYDPGIAPPVSEGSALPEQPVPDATISEPAGPQPDQSAHVDNTEPSDNNSGGGLIARLAGVAATLGLVQQMASRIKMPAMPAKTAKTASTVTKGGFPARKPPTAAAAPGKARPVAAASAAPVKTGKPRTGAAITRKPVTPRGGGRGGPGGLSGPLV